MSTPFNISFFKFSDEDIDDVSSYLNETTPDSNEKDALDIPDQKQQQINRIKEKAIDEAIDVLKDEQLISEENLTKQFKKIQQEFDKYETIDYYYNVVKTYGVSLPLLDIIDPENKFKVNLNNVDITPTFNAEYHIVLAGFEGFFKTIAEGIWKAIKWLLETLFKILKTIAHFLLRVITLGMLNKESSFGGGSSGNTSWMEQTVSKYISYVNTLRQKEEELYKDYQDDPRFKNVPQNSRREELNNKIDTIKTTIEQSWKQRVLLLDDMLNGYNTLYVNGDNILRDYDYILQEYVSFANEIQQMSTKQEYADFDKNRQKRRDIKQKNTDIENECKSMTKSFYDKLQSHCDEINKTLFKWVFEKSSKLEYLPLIKTISESPDRFDITDPNFKLVDHNTNAYKNTTQPNILLTFFQEQSNTTALEDINIKQYSSLNDILIKNKIEKFTSDLEKRKNPIIKSLTDIQKTVATFNSIVVFKPIVTNLTHSLKELSMVFCNVCINSNKLWVEHCKTIVGFMKSVENLHNVVENDNRTINPPPGITKRKVTV
jgi:hypothetical protein